MNKPGRLICLIMLAAIMPLTAAADEATFDPFQRLLTQHLTESTTAEGGLVSAFDYEAALASSQTDGLVTDQRDRLADFDIRSLDGESESVAFWLNAYNFFMIDQILTERPDGELVDSVWDYGGRVNPFVDSVFDREKFLIDGRAYSLNQMEKDILLGEAYADKGWKDARVHFAVNCASVGCPPLRDVVYTADNLESLLAENTRRAFATKRHLEIKGDTLHVTELFKWYEGDFVEASGSRKAFIEKWVDSALADRIEGTSELTFIEYDWSLNKPANFPKYR
ncbi:DUF547 domain-containing protein [Marinobacter sp.]|uniref:DUF547 domain-containing protein n=1 Tax=Marinobacter sp. TaxID=50741 RepID=UPI003BABD86E